MKCLARLLLVASLSLFAGFSLVGCSANPPSAAAVSPTTHLTVFAAASLTESFNAIAEAYSQAHPSVSITYNFAGSQQLVQQLSQGAQADIFASAAPLQMNQAIQAGRVDSSEVKNFASNHLVVIYPKGNPGQVKTLQDLAHPGLQIILAAQNVPVGQYAQEFLQKANQDPSFGPTYQAGVMANIVSYEDSVKNVVSKIQLGEADAGIVYATDAAAAKDEVGSIDIPEQLNVRALYPISVIKDSQQTRAAQEFVDFVVSSRGQEILAKFGFQQP